MLVLSRQKMEEVIVGGLGSPYPEMIVAIVDIRGDKVRLGITAPDDCPVNRREVFEAIQREGKRGDSSSEGDGQ